MIGLALTRTPVQVPIHVPRVDSVSRRLVTVAAGIASESLLLLLYWFGPVAQAQLPAAPSDQAAADATGRDQAADSIRSATIDQFIEAAHAAAGRQPNPIVDDATFRRRVYLDIVGRIPTFGEAQQFLDSSATDKRQALVDHLLASPGYPLHQFSYWANLLRAKSKMPGGPSDFYTAWIKQNIRENTPYDRWVREMLAARGYIWSTPATGYFQRDQGMPLDNMANTVQVFLGTRLECAQCHNHPSEAWTQHDFYRTAAYRNHLSTVFYHQGQWPAMQQILDERGASKEVRIWASRTFAFRKRRVYDAGRQLRLPDDYADDDAMPGQVVEPATIYGQAACSDSTCDRQQSFAEWLASPSNPYFTKVIANRMWKRVMGRGLIEPVDDMNRSTTASHPELLHFLERLMVDSQYNLKRFQRVLYNTRTYQRAVCSMDLTGAVRYGFPGPLLKQMTAEQLWDSLMTLMAPDIDLRQSERFRKLPFLRENFSAYEQATPAELVDASYQAEEVRRLHNETHEKLFELEKRIAAADKSGDAELLRQLRAKVVRLEQFRDHEIPVRIDGGTFR